jgi:hypothetical protein
LSLTSEFPNGKAQLVISLKTGSAGGKLIKRIPFMYENPLFGKPVEKLPVTQSLIKEFPDSKVVELFNGAPLNTWGLTTYDGTRDIYFGDGRGHRFNGNMSTRGSHGKLLYKLDLGGGECRRALMKFDLSMIPKDTKVKKAYLMLHASSVPTKHRRAKVEPDKTFLVHAMKKKWHDRSAGIYGGYASTRRPERPSNIADLWPWEKDCFNGGSDRIQDPVKGELKEKGWQQLDITEFAQKWINGSLENNGMSFQMTAERNAKDSESTVKNAGSAVLVASDNIVTPVTRPRLVLVLKGGTEKNPAPIEEINPDLDKILAGAKQVKKPVLISFLTNRLVSGRNFNKIFTDETIDKSFLEVRLNADDPKNKDILKKYGVGILPAAVITTYDEKGREMFNRVEPLWWKNVTGYSLHTFEISRSYAGMLNSVLGQLKGIARQLKKKRTPVYLRYRISEDGTVIDVNGPPGDGCG